MKTHSQVVRLLEVQVVPAAGLRGCLGWGLQLCWAWAGRSDQEAALGGVGNGDGGPAALLLHHCLDWAQRDSISTAQGPGRSRAAQEALRLLRGEGKLCLHCNLLNKDHTGLYLKYLYSGECHESYKFIIN